MRANPAGKAMKVRTTGKSRAMKTVTSPRRYTDRGPLARILRNWRVLTGYFAGVSPEKLERWYREK